MGTDLVEQCSSEGSRRAARAELAILAAGAQPYARVRLEVGGLSFLHVEPVVGAPGFFLATAAKTIESGEETAAFEVSTRPEEFGRVLRRAAEGVWFDVPAGTRCLDLLCGSSECCADCPAMAISEKAPIVSRATAAQGAEGHCYVVTARVSGPERALVTAIRIDDSTRAKLASARVDAAASAAGLSEREKQVLRLLLLGRELADVAAELGISHRTVRFHQTNLLDKLGVESRADLARLLL
ncbi:MAG: helix-turn-helix transcriptional regulator [Polyangiaceae bacterium]|nr:helix-turn-helix transcriptional regulator [Polyangiaceae bacterium]